MRVWIGCATQQIVAARMFDYMAYLVLSAFFFGVGVGCMVCTLIDKIRPTSTTMQKGSK
jgi:hypothetical protein